MIDSRTFLTLVANSTQEECRELGKLFTSLADAPRDVHWRASFTEKLAALPAFENRGRAERLEVFHRYEDEIERLWLDAELGHRQLVNEELRRRGDARTYDGVRQNIAEAAHRATFRIHGDPDGLLALARPAREQGPG